MTTSSLKRRLPGLLATALVILTTSLWTFWGTAELYYEGGGLPFPQPLAYLVSAAVCLTFSLLSLRWPRPRGMDFRPGRDGRLSPSGGGEWPSAASAP